jgi:hypothetical protein
MRKSETKIKCVFIVLDSTHLSTLFYHNFLQEIPLVIAARIFDRPINKLSIKELNDALHGSKQGMIG